MSTSQTLFAPDFFQKIMAEATGQAADGLRRGLIASAPIIRQYLPFVVGIWVVIGVLSFTKALTGRWGAFGSWLYHTLYFVVIGTFIWLAGVEILFNDFFDLFCFIFYLFCFWLTGRILKACGFIH
jgi:uncharacterized membrane protein (GlpM family)